MSRLNLELLVEQVQSVQARRTAQVSTNTASSVELALQDFASQVERGEALETQIDLVWH